MADNYEREMIERTRQLEEAYENSLSPEERKQQVYGGDQHSCSQPPHSWGEALPSAILGYYRYVCAKCKRACLKPMGQQPAP